MLKCSLAACLIATLALAIPTAAEPPGNQQPTLTQQNSGTTNGLIAVSPVNPQVVWASGRAGTFVVTTDGGNTWNAGVVQGAELLQFRDVEGVSRNFTRYVQGVEAQTTSKRQLLSRGTAKD